MIALSLSSLLTPLTMAAMATASVGLWTLRVALAARGRKAAGAAVAAVEAVVFAMAFTRLTSGLNAPARVGGYALGVAAGTLLGLALDERLSRGGIELRVVAPGLQPHLSQALHHGGCPTTWLTGQGPDGPVTLLFVTADDSRLAALVEKVQRTVPGALWTIHRLGPAPSTGSARRPPRLGPHAKHLARRVVEVEPRDSQVVQQPLTGRAATVSRT